MSDQVALRDKLKRAIVFHIDGVSLPALHGGEDSDNSTVVRCVFIDDVTNGKFWHQTFRIMNRVSGGLDQYGLRDVRFAQSARNDRLPHSVHSEALFGKQCRGGDERLRM
jgi:hypothetical protein